MELNDLFRKQGIDPATVLVLRHRPSEPQLRKVLPWLAAEKPALFNAYQQTQGEKVEKSMLRATHVASFIGHEPGKALFVGLYAITDATPLTHDEFWRVPENQALHALGMQGFTDADERATIQWFALEHADFYEEWCGKLIVDWPGLERSWWRQAHNNTIRIHAILEDSALDPALKDWKDLVFTWEELGVLPKRLQHALAQWRGIYYIHDTTDEKGYVGAAYGDENILGR